MEIMGTLVMSVNKECLFWSIPKFKIEPWKLKGTFSYISKLRHKLPSTYTVDNVPKSF